MATRKIETEFYLINSNDTWLERNFKFIQAIFAGTDWLHMKYCIIRPPNVYNVLCPGRFMFMWAAMDITVTFEGKLRKNSNVSNKINNDYGVKSINSDMLWPDAWKIKINIKDFTPNNFNMYADYYMRGFVADEIESLSEKIGIDKIASELFTYIKDFGSEVGSAINESFDKVSSNLSDMENISDSGFLGDLKSKAQQQKDAAQQAENAKNAAEKNTNLQSQQ